MRVWKNKTEFKHDFTQKARVLFEKRINQLNKRDVYQVLAGMIRDLISDNWIKTNETYAKHQVKQIYYFSIEFLLGRLLQSNLTSCGMEDLCRDALKDMGWDLDDIIPQEPDAGLGNGGLGRLAACFIDSMAAMNLPGHGCSIRYQYGLFDQRIVDGQQVELPDNWLRNGFPWEIKRSDKSVFVNFGGNAYMRPDADGNLECVHEDCTMVRAVPYDVPVLGYHNNTVNTLRLWKAEYTREGMYGNLLQGNYHQAMRYKDSIQQISRFLYPDDSTYEGRKLRLMQEYFFVSAGVQSIIRHYLRTGGDLKQLHRNVALHINDTHPALVIPELMRILMDENGLDWDDAWMITTSTVAYTNHTVLPEAMERWPIEMFKPLLPRIYMIIEEIHKKWMKTVRAKFPNDDGKARDVAILWDNQVHMAHLAVLGSHSVNGVAEIHSNILKESTLHQFYEWFPQRFSNKTNGVTHRRWLMNSNPQLTKLIDETIGCKWHREPELLQDLEKFADDASFQEKLAAVKHQRKEILTDYVYKSRHIKLNPDSIFDIHIKRIHMYKRQILNILHVYHLYQELLANPGMDFIPRTFLFGGKAAASYGEAKMTIKLINRVAEMVNKDRHVSRKLKVLFLENYNVSLGQLLYPSADVSEQISTAGKEASGTGNMKFMMNGAITLGTMDGANVEIHREVGDENCVIFGLRANEVMDYYQKGGYSSWDLYGKDENIRQVLDPLNINGDFRMLYEALLDRNDEYFVLKDFEAYCAAQKEIQRRYSDTKGWLHSSTVNIAHSGFFSSDRTIKEYAHDIWHIKPIRV